MKYKSQIRRPFPSAVTGKLLKYDKKKLSGLSGVSRYGRRTDKRTLDLDSTNQRKKSQLAFLQSGKFPLSWKSRVDISECPACNYRNLTKKLLKTSKMNCVFFLLFKEVILTCKILIWSLFLSTKTWNSPQFEKAVFLDPVALSVLDNPKKPLWGLYKNFRSRPTKICI